jgi:mono/diheme cytochrome c family protein
MYSRRMIYVAALAAFLVHGAAGASEPPAIDPAVVERGKAVYEKYCALCHGAAAEGAPNWQVRDKLGEVPAPPHNQEGHSWRHADMMLYHTVHDGARNPFNPSQRFTMPGFQFVLTPGEIGSVLTYLRTLWTPEQREFQRQETTTYKAVATQPHR